MGQPASSTSTRWIVAARRSRSTFGACRTTSTPATRTVVRSPSCLRHQSQPGVRGAARHQHRRAVNPAGEVSALLAYAESFGLSGGQARAVLHEVADAAADWPAAARRHGISGAEIARFDRTLRHTVEAVRPGLAT
ncbi:hypothetical protein [Actinoplanes sp. NPDC026623]|uniref:hypothetical protein n=1 Tax=Actinoplanes sp. NPDC026623 TaxID=3155610 RepID=UPI00340F6DAD